jgi:DNA-directed RNA polymerase specialized sigma24 family protein
MKDIRKIHREAMELAKNADQARLNGNKQLFHQLTEDAYRLEKEASDELIAHPDSEPTRGVLFRSAATLAFNIGRWSEAKELIETALSGNPFPEIKAELQELQEKVIHEMTIQPNYESIEDYSLLSIVREPEFSYGILQRFQSLYEVNELPFRELFKSLSNFDGDTFKRTYSNFVYEVSIVVLIYVPDQGAIQDILGETFRSFFSRYQLFELSSISQARTLLYLTAHYNSRRYLQFKGINPEASFDKLETSYQRSESIKTIKEFFVAFDSLSEQTVGIMDLFLEGYTAPEIAERLSLTTRAVLNYKDEVINLLPKSKQ